MTMTDRFIEVRTVGRDEALRLTSADAPARSAITDAASRAGPPVALGRIASGAAATSAEPDTARESFPLGKV